MGELTARSLWAHAFYCMAHGAITRVTELAGAVHLLVFGEMRDLGVGVVPHAVAPNSPSGLQPLQAFGQLRGAKLWPCVEELPLHAIHVTRGHTPVIGGYPQGREHHGALRPQLPDLAITEELRLDPSRPHDLPPTVRPVLPL